MDCNARLGDSALARVLEGLWSLLEHAVEDRHNSFRTPALATIIPGAGCTLRTVILRAVDRERRTLRFYCDLRSPKLAHIRADPRIAFLFHDPVRQVQVRADARAEIYHDGLLAERSWATLDPANRINYSAAVAPGTVIAAPAPRPAATDPETGRANFAVAECRVHHLEWLELDSNGHRRAGFTWNEAGGLDAVWLEP